MNYPVNLVLIYCCTGSPDSAIHIFMSLIWSLTVSLVLLVFLSSKKRKGKAEVLKTFVNLYILQQFITSTE